VSYLVSDESVPSAVHLLESRGLVLGNQAAELASKLFALSVQLETVLAKRKRRFQSEVERFTEEIEEKRKGLAFNPQVVTRSVDYDERVGGFYSLVLGLFGYERRVRKVRLVYTKQLSTKEIACQIQRFVAESRSSFGTKVEALLDVDGLVGECLNLASEKLKPEDTALLRVAVRRALEKVSVVPIKIRFAEAPHRLLTEPDEIEAAIQNALRDADRLTHVLVSRANSARRSIDAGLAAILETLKEELVKAFLERKEMERLIEQAMAQSPAPLLPYESKKQLVSPLGTDEWRRMLLGRIVY
jgi:hypothetical protein